MSAPPYHSLGIASSSSSSTSTGSTNSVEGGGNSWPHHPIPTAANRPQRSEKAPCGNDTGSSNSRRGSGGSQQHKGNIPTKVEQEQCQDDEVEDQDDEVEDGDGEGEGEEDGVDDETKRQKRLELNRKAAHESRKRKKAKYQQLIE